MAKNDKSLDAVSLIGGGLAAVGLTHFVKPELFAPITAPVFPRRHHHLDLPQRCLRDRDRCCAGVPPAPDDSAWLAWPATWASSATGPCRPRPDRLRDNGYSNPRDFSSR